MDAPDPLPEPPNLRFLRRLVTVLTAVMIAGLLTVIVLLVIRLSDRRSTLVFPGDLPIGAQGNIVGYSQTGDHIVVVLDDGRIMVFDADSRALTQEITLD